MAHLMGRIDGEDDMDAEELEALRQREKKRKAQPMSLEEKMAERLNAAELDKPVFMTREMREVAEKEENDEEDEIQQLMQEAEREQRQHYMQKVRDAIREQRQNERGSRTIAYAPAKPQEPVLTKEEEDKQKEMQQIKNAYLGVKKKKKKVMKISEKFRFSFDWGADEDTSVDLNPLYEKKHEVRIKLLPDFSSLASPNQPSPNSAMSLGPSQHHEQHCSVGVVAIWAWSTCRDRPSRATVEAGQATPAVCTWITMLIPPRPYRTPMHVSLLRFRHRSDRSI